VSKWARHRCARRRPFRRNCRRQRRVPGSEIITRRAEAAHCSSSAMVSAQAAKNAELSTRLADAGRLDAERARANARYDISSPICIASRVTFRSRQMKPFFSTTACRAPSCFLGTVSPDFRRQRFGSAVSQIRGGSEAGNMALRSGVPMPSVAVLPSRCSLRSARDLTHAVRVMHPRCNDAR